MDGVAAARPAVTNSNVVKVGRPPYLSVSIPIGNLANDPSSTGAATKMDVSVLLSPSSCLKVGAKPLTSPQAIKHSANEIVPKSRCGLFEQASIVIVAPTSTQKLSHKAALDKAAQVTISAG